jgi:hypothetical protein
MDTKKWILLVVMTVALMATAFAQEKNRKNTDNDSEMRRRAFREQISPLISAERDKLDQFLSTEDLATVDALKKQMRNERLLMLELQCEMRAAELKGDNLDRDIEDELKAQRIVIKNSISKAEAIVERYEEEIDELMANVREEARSMRRGKNGNPGFEDGDLGRGPCGPGFLGREMNRHGGPGNMTKVGFLLWETERS